MIQSLACHGGSIGDDVASGAAGATDMSTSVSSSSTSATGAQTSGSTGTGGAPVAIVNPVVPDDFADPFVLRVGNTYHGYATNRAVGGFPVRIPHITSTNLADWSAPTEALTGLGPWAEDGFFNWAPGVLRVSPTRYVLYYASKRAGSSPSGQSGQQCLGRAIASSPEGPFVDELTSPFVCDTGPQGYWSIDPSPFRDAGGKIYLLWRQDGAPSAINRAVIRELAPDGASFAAGSSIVPLVSRDPGSWEDPVLENPSMVEVSGTYFVFYSANRWETASYGIGYATCSSVLGPCQKKTGAGPWFGSVPATTLRGPGGQDFFNDPGGGIWMSMHGWVEPNVGPASGGGRALWLTHFAIDAGVPVITSP